MSVQVVFLKSAEHDLKELKGYLVKNFGKDTWQASYTKIKDAVNTIGTFPLGGNFPKNSSASTSRNTVRLSRA